MIQLQLSDKTELLLNQILALYNPELFFKSAIDNKINDLNLGIRNIQKDLIEFEKKYSISTEYFYEKFNEGEFGDEDDFMIWAGIYEMLLRSKQTLEKLK